MAHLRVAAVIVLLAAFACGDPAFADEAAGFRADDVTFESRGVMVPATFVRPAAAAGPPYPIVVMAHGHGGTRDEAGGFRRLAEALARRGIASIRPDFPGCGQSTEAFSRNNLTNMLADARAALAHGLRQPGVDPARTGIVGYSMGARVAMLLLGDGYAAAALWAPVGTDGPGAIFPLVGGRAKYLELRERAEDTGAAAFVTPWGQSQALGRQWFVDLETYMPMAALRSYPGALLVIIGAADTIVDPAIARAVAAAAAATDSGRLKILAGADHGLGFYGDDPAVGEHVIETTADFLASTLTAER